MNEHAAEEHFLLWAAGRLPSEITPLFESHVRYCVTCGENLNAATLLTDISGEVPSGFTLEMSDEKLTETARLAAQISDEAEHFFEETPPAHWAQGLPLHSDEGRGLLFLHQITNVAVQKAAAYPDEVLDLLEAIRRTPEFPETGPILQSDLNALLALAQSVALRVKGDLMQALQVILDGERQLQMPLESTEAPRLHLAAATVYHMLDNLDDAETRVALARQGYWRAGTRSEIAKCHWLASHIALDRGHPASAFRRAKRAYRMLKKQESPQAKGALRLIALVLVHLRRVRLATRILDELEQDADFMANRYDAAHCTWIRGSVAMAEERFVEATVLFEDASRAYADLGVPFAAARYSLDAAVAASLLGDVPRQRRLAEHAVLILTQTPGLEGQAATALGVLRNALEKEQGLASAVRALRSRINLRSG